MSETIGLSELQIKRRELENELASLSQKEKTLESDLRTLEEKIIHQLKEEIRAKKSALSSLEARKNDLERKLSELQGKPAGSQTAEERHVKGETTEPAQHDDTEVTVFGYQPEQIQETGQSTKKDDKRDWRF